jgi:hypothetical protein
MIKGFFLLLTGLFALEQNVSAPPVLAWKTLEGIGFDKRFVEDMNDYFIFPEFTKQIKALEGKTVDVEGYVIPFDKTGAEVALSANPYAACFFCGKAGPASIMIVKLKVKNTKLRTDMYKTFRGKLKLNATDPEEFYYILEDAILMD